jgi:DNA-binding LacI/PurR family transcriptional regulator
LVEYARRTGLEIGSDLGIVSYNETPLKKIAANGISVLSTDFYELGCQIAEMVINNEKSLKYNSFRFINRNSF